MINISGLVELRFLILKIVKEAKTKMTVEEIARKLPNGSYCITTEISDAIRELDYYKILDVEYKEGFSCCSYPNNGHAIISVSI